MLKYCINVLLPVILVTSNLYSSDFGNEDFYSIISNLSNWNNNRNFVSNKNYYNYSFIPYSCNYYNNLNYNEGNYNNSINSPAFDYLFTTYLKKNKNMYPKRPKLSEIPEIIKHFLIEQKRYEKKINNYKTNLITDLENIKKNENTNKINNNVPNENNKYKINSIQEIEVEIEYIDNKTSFYNKYKSKFDTVNYNNKFSNKTNYYENRYNKINYGGFYNNKLLYDNSNTFQYNNNNDNLLCNMLDNQINNLQYYTPKYKKKSINNNTQFKNIVKTNTPNNNIIFDENKKETKMTETTIDSNHNIIFKCETNISQNNTNIEKENENINKNEIITNNKCLVLEDIKINNEETNKEDIKYEDNISEKTNDTRECKINEDNNIEDYLENINNTNDINNINNNSNSHCEEDNINNINDSKENINIGSNEINNSNINSNKENDSFIEPPKNPPIKKLTQKEMKEKQLKNKRKRNKHKKIANKNQTKNEVLQKSIQKNDNAIENNNKQEESKINEIIDETNTNNIITNVQNSNLNETVNNNIQEDNIIIMNKTTEDKKIEDNNKEEYENQTVYKKKKKNRIRYKHVKEEEDKKSKEKKEQDAQQIVVFNKELLQKIENHIQDFNFYMQKFEYKYMNTNKTSINEIYQNITQHFDKLLTIFMNYFDSNLYNKTFEEFTNEDKLILSLSYNIIQSQVFNKNEYNSSKSNISLVNIMMNAGIESCTNNNDLIKWINKNVTENGMKNIDLKLFVNFIIYGIHNTLGEKLSTYQQKVYNKIYDYFKPIASYMNKHEKIFKSLKEQRQNNSSILDNNDREYLIKEYSKSLLPILNTLFQMHNYTQLKKHFSELLENIIININLNKYINNLYNVITEQVSDFIINNCNKQNIDIMKNVEVIELVQNQIDKFFDLIKNEIDKSKIKQKIFDYTYKTTMDNLWESRPDFMKEDTPNNNKLEKFVKQQNCQII